MQDKYFFFVRFVRLYFFPFHVIDHFDQINKKQPTLQCDNVYLFLYTSIHIHTHHQCSLLCVFFLYTKFITQHCSQQFNQHTWYVHIRSIYNRASCIVYLLCTSKIFKKRVKDIKVLLFLFCVINPVFAQLFLLHTVVHVWFYMGLLLKYKRKKFLIEYPYSICT